MQPAATDPAPPASEAPEPVPPPRLAAVDLTAGCLVAGAATAAVVCVMSLAVTGGWSSMAGDRLLDAQRDLARAGDLEASELEPFLPRVSGWKSSFGSTVRREGEPVGYSLSFEQEGASGSVVDRDRWSVDVELAGTGDPCPPVGSFDCEREDTYEVIRSGTTVYGVRVQRGVVVLVVRSEFDGDLPSRSEIGRALEEADRSVSFLDLVRMG